MVIFSRCGKVQHPMNALAALPSVPGFTFTAKTSEGVLEQTGSRPTASERWSTVKKVVLSEKSNTKTLESDQEYVEAPPKKNDVQEKDVISNEFSSSKPKHSGSC